MIADDDVPLVRRETAGHEADKLLRTVVRAFYDDTCSIVLDIVLRNHYETKEKDILGVCKNVNPQVVREALSKLQSAGLLETHVRQPYWVAASKYQARAGPRYRGFTPFHYDLQRKQQTEEQDFEERKERKAETFYYVNYTKAVERIRYRVFKLLSDGTEADSSTLSTAQKACVRQHLADLNRGAPELYACSRGAACPRRYTFDEAARYMNAATAMMACPACGSRLVRVKDTAPASAPSKDAARARYREALRPLSDLLNVVTRSTYAAFKEYSPEEEKLLNEHKRKEEEEKRRSAGYVDDIVVVEESLAPPAGALDESIHARNGAIPWLARSTFFDDDFGVAAAAGSSSASAALGSAFSSSSLSETSSTSTSTSTSALEPAAKRARNEASAVEEGENGEEEEDAEARAAMAAFDRQLQELLEATAVPESEVEEDEDEYDDDVVPESDGASVHSGSSSSGFSGDGSAASSPLMTAAAAQRACRGFAADVLGARVVAVQGVPCALRALTLADLLAMSDAEYRQYGRTIAEIAGV